MEKASIIAAAVFAWFICGAIGYALLRRRFRIKFAHHRVPWSTADRAFALKVSLTGPCLMLAVLVMNLESVLGMGSDDEPASW